MNKLPSILKTFKKEKKPQADYQPNLELHFYMDC